MDECKWATKSRQFNHSKSKEKGYKPHHNLNTLASHI